MADFVDLRLQKSGLKIIVDSMFGAGSGYFNQLLEGGSTKIIEINGERNPPSRDQPGTYCVNLKKALGYGEGKAAGFRYRR
jgi:phosphomannomutase